MIPGKCYRVMPEFTRGKDRAGTDNGQWMWGRCVWVHPKGRFALLEFEFPGGTLRECFRREELISNHEN